MNKAIRAIALSDDISIIRAFEYFHGELSGALQATMQELEKVLATAGAAAIVDYVREREEHALDPVGSVETARFLLVSAADKPGLSELVLRCVDEWPDDWHSVRKILTVGAVGAVWMVLACTRVDYEGGRLAIHKTTMAAEGFEMAVGKFKMKLDMHVYDPKTGAPSLHEEKPRLP